MEHLFSPCSRVLRGPLYPLPGPVLPEIKLDVSTEELLSVERAFTYTDLYDMLGDRSTIAWLTPDAYIVHACRRATLGYRISFDVDGRNMYAVAHRSLEHLLEICFVVIRLLAASVVHSVNIQHYCSREGVFINAPALAYLMEQCKSLKILSLTDLEMDESHSRVLGSYSRPDLEITLDRCRITRAGTSALAEVLRSNQGPTKLDSCYIDNSVLATGLRGNSRLKSFRPQRSNNRDADNQELLAIAAALKENKGLVDLDLSYLRSGPFWEINEASWHVVCDSLKTHPTLQVLNLYTMRPFGEASPYPALLESPIQTLLDMMKVNKSIHTIRPPNRHYSEHELYRKLVVPYLEMNQLRPRVHAIQKACPIAYRAKVLGRALLAVRTDANSFWMLLSGNAEVAFPSTTATTTATANLATPTTAAVNLNAAAGPVAAATPGIPVSAAWVTFVTGATTAAKYVPPTTSTSACQKRKAHP
jgi:hypothetical protein